MYFLNIPDVALTFARATVLVHYKKKESTFSRKKYNMHPETILTESICRFQLGHQKSIVHNSRSSSLVADFNKSV
jgi:hypothetical protein